MSRRRPLGGGARKSLLIAGLVAVFLTFGLPRWLAGDVPSSGSRADANFSKVCRDHGGTPTVTPGSGTRTESQRFCEVRYGRQVYVMDAITPSGFDEDTARFQRQGCEEASRQQRAGNASRRRREAFIYHPNTGVCEHRP